MQRGGGGRRGAVKVEGNGEVLKKKGRGAEEGDAMAINPPIHPLKLIVP